MITIVEATENNLNQVCDILLEVTLWLDRKGMPLWQKDQISIERMRSYVGKRELFVALFEGEPVGTIIIQSEDRDYWPEITDRSSLFFHKLAVSRKYAGKGVSKSLMEYAFDLAKKRGCKFLRLDCSAGHGQLRKFYESNGFQFHDQRQVGDLLVDRLFKMVIT